MSKEETASALWSSLNAAAWGHRVEEDVPTHWRVQNCGYPQRTQQAAQWLNLHPCFEAALLTCASDITSTDKVSCGEVGGGCNLLLKQHGKPLRFKFYLLVWLVTAACKDSDQLDATAGLKEAQPAASMFWKDDHIPHHLTIGYCPQCLSFWKTDIHQKK